MGELIDLLGERARRSEPIAPYTLVLRVARDARETVWDWSAEHAVAADADDAETARGLVLALRGAAEDLERQYGLADPAPGGGG